MRNKLGEIFNEMKIIFQLVGIIQRTVVQDCYMIKHNEILVNKKFKISILINE